MIEKPWGKGGRILCVSFTLVCSVCLSVVCGFGDFIIPFVFLCRVCVVYCVVLREIVSCRLYLACVCVICGEGLVLCLPRRMSRPLSGCHRYVCVVSKYGFKWAGKEVPLSVMTRKLYARQGRTEKSFRLSVCCYVHVMPY
jgi:hypothetical protein